MKFKKLILAGLLLPVLMFSETVYNKNMNLDAELDKIQKLKKNGTDGTAQLELEKQRLNAEIEVAKLQGQKDVEYGTATRLKMLKNELQVAIQAKSYQNEIMLPIKTRSSFGNEKNIYVNSEEYTNAISQLVEKKKELQTLQKNLGIVKGLEKTANLGIVKKYIDKIELETATMVQQVNTTPVYMATSQDGTTATTATKKAGGIQKINLKEKIYGFITTRAIGNYVVLKAN